MVNIYGSRAFRSSAFFVWFPSFSCKDSYGLNKTPNLVTYESIWSPSLYPLTRVGFLKRAQKQHRC
jgi:hypothetical protein